MAPMVKNQAKYHGNGTGNSHPGTPRHSPPVNEGQRLLRLRLARPGVSLRTIGADVGVSHVTVLNWEKGAKVPAEDAARDLARLHGIPVDAWGQAPAGEAGAPTASVPAPPSVVPVAMPAEPASAGDSLAVIPVPVDDGDPRARLVAQEGRLRTMLGTDLSPSSRIQCEKALGACLKQISALDGSQLTESKLVRHPVFQRLWRAVVAAIAPAPIALASARDALALTQGAKSHCLDDLRAKFPAEVAACESANEALQAAIKASGGAG